MYSPKESLRIQELRRKVADNTITKEELTEGLSLLRKHREGAHTTSATARTSRASASAKKNINSDNLLGELDGL